jgi:2,5-dihydroxypyridine 5,6-dioxygenase
MIEPAWLAAFETVLARCGATAGVSVCVLSETQSRATNVELARLASQRLGTQVVSLVMPTPVLALPIAVRSTGASVALQGNAAALAALCKCELIIDCTVEGLMHAPELSQVLASGARVLYVSNEHPEILTRLVPDLSLENEVKAHIKRLRASLRMHVTSAAGTNLEIDLTGAPCGGNWGTTTKPGTITHWPGGLVLAFPKAGSVNGRLVLNAGDLNLTFKRFVEQPVQLTIEDDFVVRLEGTGVDAQLLQDTFGAWESHEQNRSCYAVSHVGYGLNPAARWHSLVYYDKADVNGTEQRCFAGNFLYSTGANETANRFTLGHFDLPLRGCSVALDGALVVDAGRLV